MRIGIVTSYATQQPAGLERFLLDLLCALDSLSGAKYVVYTKKGTGLAAILKENSIFNIDVVEVGFGKFWKDIGLFFTSRADAYIFNGPIVPVFFAPKNYFVILHDFAYKHIKMSTLREKLKHIMIDMLTRKALYRAKKIITVSDATKHELVKFFGGNLNNIKTIYPGFRKVCLTKEELVSGINAPYFLYVGTLKERKNVLSLVEAFLLYKKEKKDTTMLVIVGKKNMKNPYVRKLYNTVERGNSINDVIFTGHISDAQISYIYKNAVALVFPSLLEGFGFPVLEAMSCGLPVITSNTGSLAEISGDAAALVDPLNVVEITAAMKKIVDDELFKTKLITSGLKRAQMFNWSTTAQELVQFVINGSQAV